MYRLAQLIKRLAIAITESFHLRLLFLTFILFCYALSLLYGLADNPSVTELRINMIGNVVSTIAVFLIVAPIWDYYYLKKQEKFERKVQLSLEEIRGGQAILESKTQQSLDEIKSLIVASQKTTRLRAVPALLGTLLSVLLVIIFHRTHKHNP